MATPKYDPVPHLKPAGKVIEGREVTALTCLKQEGLERPETPKEIKRFRKSTKEVVGRTVTHYGKAVDAPPPDMSFGAKNKFDSSAQETVNPKPETFIEKKTREKKESTYQQVKKEPLGKSISREYQFPEPVQAEDFKFGVMTKASESAKNVLYPEDQEEAEDEYAKVMYKRSHGNYEPGEQKKREYNWGSPGIDPSDHKFGIVDTSGVKDGVMKCLNPIADENVKKSDKVVNKVQADVSRIAKDRLGKPKNLGMGNRNVPPDMMFGVPSSKVKEWGAEECLRGAYSEEDQQPDKDLGKSVRFGFRNDTSIDRTFGVPTIRKDIGRPKKRSVADSQNYGGEPNARGVIFPTRFGEQGVFEEDFLELRTKDELFEVVQDAGFNISNEEFEKIFELAQSYETEENEPKGGRCSLEEFRRAKRELGL